MHNTMAGALLAVAAFCAGTASAQSTAQVSISDFTWALVDLDPGDGIAASLTFLPPEPAQSSSGWITIDAGGAVSDLRQGGAAFAPVSVAGGNAYGSASGAISGSPGAGFTLTSTAALTSPAGTGTLSSQLSTGYLGFVLSPMTAVTFSARAVLDLGLDLPAPLTSGSTSASARLDLNYDMGGTPQSWSEVASLGTTGGPRSSDSLLSFTVVNVLGSPSNNELQFGSSIDAQVLAAPVPEPSTWAMFAGGLALLFGHARLRRQRSARM